MKKELRKILKQAQRIANRKSGASVNIFLLKENNLYYNSGDVQRLNKFDSEADYRIKNNIPEKQKILILEYV